MLLAKPLKLEASHVHFGLAPISRTRGASPVLGEVDDAPPGKHRKHSGLPSPHASTRCPHLIAGSFSGARFFCTVASAWGWRARACVAGVAPEGRPAALAGQQAKRERNNTKHETRARDSGENANGTTAKTRAGPHCTAPHRIASARRRPRACYVEGARSTDTRRTQYGSIGGAGTWLKKTAPKIGPPGGTTYGGQRTATVLFAVTWRVPEPPRALDRRTPRPLALRRRELRGFVREAGLVEGRAWGGKARATNGSEDVQNLKPQRPKLGRLLRVFSRARVPISGPILRTRFWSRKRDHAADVRRPQMTIPCMTS